MRLLPRHPVARFALASFAVLVVGAATVVRAQGKNSLAALPAVGTQVPRFDFEMLGHATGARLSPDRLAGKPALLVIWSADCKFSLQALAGLERLRAKYEPHGVPVVIVAHEGDAKRMRRFADSAGVRMPIALANGGEHVLADPAAWTRLTAKSSFPKFLVVDANGRVAYRTIGVAPHDSAGRQHPFPALESVLDSLTAPARQSSTVKRL
jgi:hypothetical protein